MDYDRIEERLLWLEAQGLAVAAEARKLRRRARQVALVDEPELVREVARLSIVADVRRDEVDAWRTYTDKKPGARPIPMLAPLRRWYWPW